MFDGMAVEAARPAPVLMGSMAVTASASYSTSAGGLPLPTVKVSLFNPNALKFHTSGLDSSLHGRWTLYTNLRPHERKKHQYKKNKYLVRDLTSANINTGVEFSKSAPSSSLKNLRFEKTFYYCHTTCAHYLSLWLPGHLLRICRDETPCDLIPGTR